MAVPMSPSPISSTMSPPMSPPLSPSSPTSTSPSQDSPQSTRTTAPPTPTNNEYASSTNKLKGPRGLVKHLRRISSSPPLSRLTRSTSFVYDPQNLTTASSVSLSPSPTTSMRPLPGASSTQLGPRTPQPAISSAVRSTRQPTTFKCHWDDLPVEIQLKILSYAGPRALIRCSAVSKSWARLCLDGQLWSVFETYAFYQDIPAQNLLALINKTAPFIRYLGLRGCVQLSDQNLGSCLTQRLDSLEYLILADTQLEKDSIHAVLGQCSSITFLNLSGLEAVSNHTLRLAAKLFPDLQHLDISWCHNADARGLRKIVRACPRLRNLLAMEIGHWDDVEIMQALFERNTLETLTLGSCDSLTDNAFKVLMLGKEPQHDVLSGKPMVPVRRLRWLNLYYCRSLTSAGLRHAAHCLENLVSLSLTKCHLLTDEAIVDVIPTMPNLQHLDLEDVRGLSNDSLLALSAAPCAGVIRTLGLSQCERLDDTGMVQVLRKCNQLVHLEVDNTQISDLTLAEAAAALKRRDEPTSDPKCLPRIGLRLNAYDCPVITWAGVREIVSRNAEVTLRRRASVTDAAPTQLTTRTLGPSRPAQEVECLFPTQIIALRCVYTYQEVVEEHTKRVMRGDFAAANRLERKWAGAVLATWENVTTAPRRPRPRANRRTRQAWRAFRLDVHEDARPVHAIVQAAVAAGTIDEAGHEPATARETGIGGARRRARSSGCVVM